MAPLILVFGTPLDWENRLPIYVATLADLPLDLIEPGIVHYLRNGKFFPMPSELRAPVIEEFSRRRRAAMLLKIAVDRVRPEEQSAPPSDEEREQVTRVLSEHGITSSPRRRGREVERGPSNRRRQRDHAAELEAFRQRWAATEGAQ